MQEDCDNEDITLAVKDALEKKGCLSSIRAKLRAEIFHVLENKCESIPKKPQEVFLATEMIREFLIAFGFENTLSVFVEESGQPPEMNCDRTFIASELGLSLDKKADETPLLVALIDHLQMNKNAAQRDVLSHSLVVEAD